MPLSAVQNMGILDLFKFYYIVRLLADTARPDSPGTRLGVAHLCQCSSGAEFLEVSDQARVTTSNLNRDLLAAAAALPVRQLEYPASLSAAAWRRAFMIMIMMIMAVAS